MECDFKSRKNKSKAMAIHRQAVTKWLLLISFLCYKREGEIDTDISNRTKQTVWSGNALLGYNMITNKQTQDAAKKII